MGVRNINRNVLLVIRTAEALGSELVRVHNARKHTQVVMRTPSGVEFSLRVSQGYIEPYKQKGWVRQAIRRADGRAEHYRQQNRR